MDKGIYPELCLSKSDNTIRYISMQFPEYPFKFCVYKDEFDLNNDGLYMDDLYVLYLKEDMALSSGLNPVDSCMFVCAEDLILCTKDKKMQKNVGDKDLFDEISRFLKGIYGR